MIRTRLEAWTSSVALSISDDGWSRLERLVGLWRQYGKAMNLVGSTEPEALAQHVQEGLQCVACVETVRPVDEECRWVDVGSGGGLPGLVVAAVRPCETILIEPRKRRAAFLDLAVSAVGSAPGRVIRGRWSLSTWNEEVVGTLEPREETKFSILSSRAVFAPEIWLEEASIAPISRGIILCHVESTGLGVGRKKPRAVIRGERWAVMGFSVGEEGIARSGEG